MAKMYFDEDAERLLLGCMLNDNKCISEAISQLKGEMFYKPQHRVIFDNIIHLYKSGLESNIYSVNTLLMENGMIEKAGGSGYIAGLTNEIASSANVTFYRDIVIKHAQSRALKQSLVSHLGKIGEVETGELIRNIEDDVFKISASSTTTKIWTPKELAKDYSEYLKYNEETWNIEKGIKVGFPTLDRMTDGFQAEDVIIIGARPSIGKTALGISMMQNIIARDIPVGFISAEMSQRQIMTRMISQRTRIDGSTIRSGKYTTENRQKLYEATHYYETRKFYIDDTPNITLNALIASARHMKIHFGVKIIFIDYIGLITVTKDGPVWELVTEISKSLKALARELKIPVVALCQLGREAEENKPNISNLRGSGSVEQDADLVILLNGERDLTCYRNTNPFLERDLTLAKHRNGPCGKVYLDFEKEFTIFTEAKDQEGRSEEDAVKNMTQKERDAYYEQKNRETIAKMNSDKQPERKVQSERSYESDNDATQGELEWQ